MIHLKCIINNEAYLSDIINIANACFELGSWPLYFKPSIMIIISKPNKESYNSSKMFCQIVLLNTLEKLIKKVIEEHLQFQLISNDFIHPCQLGGLKQRSTLDTSCQSWKWWTLIIFFSYFYFLFNLFSFILFLELGLGLKQRDSHKSHDVWKNIKDSERIMSYNV